MGVETKLVLVWWMLLGLLVRSCWGAGFCGLDIQQQNKLYNFNLASPLKDYPHGVLSEDGFYKFSQNDSETGTETKFWFQLCEQMVFNHDQPVCFRCQTCGGPLHCGLTCSALMAKKCCRVLYMYNSWACSKLQSFSNRYEESWKRC